MTGIAAEEAKKIFAIKRYWHKPIALVSIIILILIPYFTKGFEYAKNLKFYYCEYWGIFLLLLLIILIWLVNSKRLFFRDKNWTLFWFLVLVSIGLLFPTIVYPQCIVGTEYDLPFIQIWGSIVILSIILSVFLIVRFHVIKDKRLVIVFGIANQVPKAEEKIWDSIEQVIQNINNSYSDIEIVVPPFGYKTTVNAYFHYLRLPFTQGDALIYAQVIEGEDDGQLGYVFTNFSSRINPRRFSHANDLQADVVIQLYKEMTQWNYLRNGQNDCERKIKIANSLEKMVLLYTSCLYILKNRCDSAVKIAETMYSTSSKENSQINLLAKSLLTNSYVIYAMNEEYEKRDYERSRDILLECQEKIPNVCSEEVYIQAIARIEYLLGDIKKSKSYTKKLNKQSWGYALNMGFYAICEKKPLEFVSYYKKLAKVAPNERNSIKRSIIFLERERANSYDPLIKGLLEFAIAYLYMFVKKRKSIVLMKRFFKNHKNDKVLPIATPLLPSFKSIEKKKR